MSFSSFMSSHMILHQSSCAYTPQHNGVVERKNRHVVETAHTLLHHKIPQRFLGDAILVERYLINRMSSSVLHDHISHSILLPNQPLFCLPPPIVGCVYFVHIPTPGQDKLSTKATKCVFLGYSRLKRGYRSYSSDTNHYFISAYVTFFENSSFSYAARPLVPDVLSIPLVLPSPDFPSPPTDVVLDHFRFILAILIFLQGLLLNHLLCRNHLLLQFRNCLMIYLLSFGKIPALLLTHILFIIFSTFIVYLYPTLP